MRHRALLYLKTAGFQTDSFLFPELRPAILAIGRALRTDPDQFLSAMVAEAGIGIGLGSAMGTDARSLDGVGKGLHRGSQVLCRLVEDRCRLILYVGRRLAPVAQHRERAAEEDAGDADETKEEIIFGALQDCAGNKQGNPGDKEDRTDDPEDELRPLVLLSLPFQIGCGFHFHGSFTSSPF